MSNATSSELDRPVPQPDLSALLAELAASGKSTAAFERERSLLHRLQQPSPRDLTPQPLAWSYNGLAQVVGTDYPEPEVMSRQSGATNGTYPDLDRFNRPVVSRWTKDLGTDVDFYRVDYAWDEASNVTLAEDGVHSGFDVSYTIDEVDRLTRAEEGSWGGSSIGNRTRDQEWTLDHVGNWANNRLDLDGDGSVDPLPELDETREHSYANELTERDIFSDTVTVYALSYDAVGNLVDDGESYKYAWDVFGRLRKVLDRSDDSLVAEYRYNGLGYRIAVHEDTDTDGDVDGSDLWYYDAFDERWRDVARFRSSDSSPKEEFLYHAAGLDGLGGSSYIDLVVLRDRDNNTAWTSASDGVLEARAYYCQNWRADVSAIVGSRGKMQHWVKYSAYGIPFGLPGADTDSDGDCDATDVTQVQTWIDGPTYNVLGDIDLDGDVDATDKSTIQNSYQGDTGGWGVLSPSGVGHGKGTAGFSYELDDSGRLQRSRHRLVNAMLGRWLSRDPIGYWRSIAHLYHFCNDSPVGRLDPTGLADFPPLILLIPLPSTCAASISVDTGSSAPSPDGGRPYCLQAALVNSSGQSPHTSGGSGTGDATDGSCLGGAQVDGCQFDARVGFNIGVVGDNGRCRDEDGEEEERSVGEWRRRDDSVNWAVSGAGTIAFVDRGTGKPDSNPSSEGAVQYGDQIDCGGPEATTTVTATSNNGLQLTITINANCARCEARWRVVVAF